MARQAATVSGWGRDDRDRQLQRHDFRAPAVEIRGWYTRLCGNHGLATAIDYVTKLGIENIQRHEQELTRYAIRQMRAIPDIRFFGISNSADATETKDHDAVVSFLVGVIHPMDLGTLLDQLGIAVRTGHHCAQPLMERFGIPGTVRASFALYNTKEEIDKLVAGIQRVVKMF